MHFGWNYVIGTAVMEVAKTVLWFVLGFLG